MMNECNYARNYAKMEKYLMHYNRRHNNSKYGTPLINSILVTNRCNLKCKHCFYYKTIEMGGKNPELSINEYEKLSASMDDFLTGIFCGGEPFMRNDFYEIIYLFQKNNNLMLADSASNGQNTQAIVDQTEKILRRSPSQSYSLGLSLDGKKDIHDEIRGAGTFDKALLTWQELKKLKRIYNNFELYVCTTMNTINEEAMADFIHYIINEMKADKISLIKTRQHPRVGESIKNICLSNYLKCVKILEKNRALMPSEILEKPQTYLLSSVNNYIYDSEKLGEKAFYCYAGIHGGFIDYNGNLGVCEVLPPIGNLRDYDMDFQKLWNSERGNMLRHEVNINVECKCCTHESEGLLPSLYFAPNKLNYERKL